jgi:hypothetical protein
MVTNDTNINKTSNHLWTNLMKATNNATCDVGYQGPVMLQAHKYVAGLTG